MFHEEMFFYFTFIYVLRFNKFLNLIAQEGATQHQIEN